MVANIKVNEYENPFDIEDDKTWGDMINEQENKNNVPNQIDDKEDGFSLES